MSVLSNLAPQLHDYKDELFSTSELLNIGFEFLDLPKTSTELSIEEVFKVINYEPLFTSWLWFDYIIKDKSFLENFLDEYPAIAKPERAELKKLINTTVFSYFEIDYSEPGHIEITDIISGEEYVLNERMAATSLNPGQVILARIAKQANHWELLMPNGSLLPITHDDNYKKALISENKSRYTIKDTVVYYSLLSNLGVGSAISKGNTEATTQPIVLSKSEAKAALTEAVDNSILKHYLTAPKLIKIIEDNHAKSKKSSKIEASNPIFFKILAGLYASTDLSDTDNLKVQIAPHLRRVGFSLFRKNTNCQHYLPTKPRHTSVTPQTQSNRHP